MPEQSLAPGTEHSRRVDNEKRRKRTQRILDAASELVSHFGYKKTSIDDIARQAHVAKGTIYLHWKTREELFASLLLRENLLASQEILQLLQQDPEGAQLHTLTRHGLSIALQRPLLQALLIRDTEILGELLHSDSAAWQAYQEQRLFTFTRLFELFRSQALIRTDQALREQLHIFSAIVLGFLSAPSYLPNELQLPLERRTELMAETIKHTFAPVSPADPVALQEVSSQILQFLQATLENLADRLQQADAI